MLTPQAGLTSEKLRDGLGALNQSLAGGPTQRIAASLMRLIAATRRPGWMDDETAAVYFDTLQEAMHDFPIDVVEEACIAWRKHGKPDWAESREYWPSEGELRGICERLFKPRRDLRFKAGELLRHLEAEEEQAERARQPSPFAGDAHRAFREAMRKRLAPHRFAAYFNPTHILFMGARDILVRSKIAAIVLNEEGADIVAQFGLRIQHDAEAFARIREVQPEQTAEDDAWVAAKMTRLTQAMERGEDIKRLMHEGAL